ncbi:MAG: aldo/keto reductase [Candidatus Tectomicrobia bacterium]|nr:aldo/keto reductase [Candidatus Tectomicrobia bacterium]
MRYRDFGTTGLKVSEIGFGAGIAAGLFISGTPDLQLQAMKKAFTLGINFFDTAPSYGHGVSETNLGLVMEELKGDVILGTKVGLQREEMKDPMGSIHRSLEGSLTRLRRNRVDILYLHNRVETERSVRGDALPAITVGDVLNPGGIADALEELQSQGLTRFIGFTATGHPDLTQLLIDSGRFQVIQAFYNLLNPSASLPIPETARVRNFRSVISMAAEKGVGVVVIRAIAGGALAGPEARKGLAGPVDSSTIHGLTYQEEERRAEKLDFLVSGDVTSRAEAALRFALMNEQVSTALVGFSSLDQIEEASRAAQKGSLPTSVWERLQALWATDFQSTGEGAH